MDEESVGYFVFSLDTELGTGKFDNDRIRASTFSPDGSRERWAIHTLLDLMDEYSINATWAIVGHLFYDHCELCDICPLMSWKGKYSSFEEAYNTNHPLWYGADIVELIQKHPRHEIGFHGYTHKIFDDQTMTLDEAKIELQEWLRVASRKGIIPKSVVFPRNHAGYLSLFHENGFSCYRSEEPRPNFIKNRYYGRYIKTLDHLFAITTPPLFNLIDLKATPSGLVAIPASMHLKGFNWGLERILDKSNLHLLRLRRVSKGIHKAAEEKKIIHLWAHPWEFQNQKDIDKLRYIFKTVAQEQKKGRIRSITMDDLSKKVS